MGRLAVRGWRSEEVVVGVERGVLFQSGRSRGCYSLNQFLPFQLAMNLWGKGQSTCKALSA